MSEQHTEAPIGEPRSKVKLVRNAKGDTQIEISVVEGCTAEELRRIRELAVAEYRAASSEFYGAAA